MALFDRSLVLPKDLHLLQDSQLYSLALHKLSSFLAPPESSSFEPSKEKNVTTSRRSNSSHVDLDLGEIEADELEQSCDSSSHADSENIDEDDDDGVGRDDDDELSDENDVDNDDDDELDEEIEDFGKKNGDEEEDMDIEALGLDDDDIDSDGFEDIEAEQRRLELDDQRNDKHVRFEKKKKETDSEVTQSKFEIAQGKMEKEIAVLEAAAAAPRAWVYRGEVQAVERPKESLLERELDFDNTAATATIAAAMAGPKLEAHIEELIRARIKESRWDGPQRVVKPVAGVADAAELHRATLVQDGKPRPLSEVYEAEYLAAQQERLTGSGVVSAAAAALVADPRHLDVLRAAEELFAKLDALSNMRAAPMQLMPRLSVNKTYTSRANAFAVPQEALKRDNAEVAPPREPLKGKSELSAADRARSRRRQKRRLRARNAAVDTSQAASGATPISDRAAALQRLVRMANKPRSQVKVLLNEGKVARPKPSKVRKKRQHS